MQFKNLIINIICILFIIPLYYITKSSNIFLYTFSLYLYLILSSMFLHIDIYNNIKKYYDNKYIYSLNTIFKYTNISIILINIFITIVIGLSSLLLNKLFNIKGLVIVNIAMSLTLFINPILKNIQNFIKVYNFKRFSDNLINIYKITNFILLIINSIIAFKLLKVDDYLKISILYLTNIISFFLVYLLSHLLVLNNKIKKKQFKKKEERIDYKKEIITILSNNKKISISTIIKHSYFYISIIILYFILTNRYGYTYQKVSEVINNSYLYSLGIINIIFLVINYIEEKDINNIKKNPNKYNLDDYLIKIFKQFLSLIVILGIISNAIWFLIFNNDNGYMLYMFSILAFFYYFYNLIIDTIINNINNKKLYIILCIGIALKLILIVPLISAIYRMGYNLLYGDALSSIISYFTVSMLLIITVNKKYNINFVKKFDRIINNIYYNIILCLVLLLFTLIIPVKATNRINSLKIIIIYLVISILYIKIRKKMKKDEWIFKRNRNKNH